MTIVIVVGRGRGAQLLYARKTHTHFIIPVCGAVVVVVFDGGDGVGGLRARNIATCLACLYALNTKRIIVYV